MSDLNKKIKLVTILNIIILAGIYLFCFTNTPDDIPGVCDECSVGSSMSFMFGTMFLIIQGIIAIVMHFSARKIEQTHSIVGIICSSIASMFFAFLQMMAVFSTTPSVHSHEYEFTEKDLAKIDMMAVQFDVGQVISGILMMAYVALIIMSICSKAQMKKEVEEDV